MAVEAEIERLRPLVYEGGYILGADHNLPPDVEVFLASEFGSVNPNLVP